MVEGVNELIICNPHKIPTEYYRYDSDHDRYYRTSGRRPSGYQSMSEDGKYGMHQAIDSVNEIRPYVDKWRASGYEGSTEITKRLLRHWKYRDESVLFFCQLEAIETIIYASEHPETVGKLITGDGSAFTRYCTKMATGTGKTVVMGMLIAWQVLNTGRKYTKNILVVTPNLTVRDRLQALRPGSRGNIYDEFDLVPAEYAGRLGSARIAITNFHQLRPKSSKPASVAKLGTQGPRSFAASILGRNASNILVINDEGHHAWRPSEYADTDSKEAEKAGMWMSGLDLIHEACAILQCHDFSATPFVPTGRSSTNETLFRWIISDFSLNDAIESGLVKTPYTPLHGDRFYHLYQQEDVSASLKKGLVPKMVRDAYQILGADWLDVNKGWSARSTPPVMITVCNSTRQAKLMVEHIMKGKFLLNTDLIKPESFLHIDSEAIKAISSDEGRRDLRDKVSTVGKPGRPGEDVCNIVSVDMLTEGWDTKTVTHIMGLRAFKSQLLCEQVVGRGLRRTSYDLNSEGLFDQEGVCVLGVPFAGILSEMEQGTKGRKGNGKNPPVEIRVKKPMHRIAWPIVAKIRTTVIVHTKINWDNVTPPQFDHTPVVSAKIGPLVDGWVAATDTEISPRHRLQTVIYGILQDVAGNLRRLDLFPWGQYSPYNESPQQSTVDMLGIVKKYVSKYVKTRLDEEGVIAMLAAYRDAIARDIFANLVKADPKSRPKADIVGTGSTDMPNKFTTKARWFRPKKTHLNIMTADSDLEVTIGQELDKNENVLSWAKSDMAGFSIPYVHPDNTERNYKPDFIAHLDTGVTLVLEGKGKEDDVDKAKKSALQLWIDAVNSEERYGIWDSATIYGDQNVRTSLEDVIRSTESKRYSHQCHACGIRTTSVADAARQFGLERIQGLLKIHAYCKKCRNKKH